MKLRTVFAAMALTVLPFAAQAQDYPNRPITMIVPFPAGGATDIAARMVAQKMTDIGGQPVIVENREGAGGIVGAVLVRDADPDGYTILFAASGTMILAPVVNPNVELVPTEDFRMVALAAQIVQYFVGPKEGPKTLGELVAAGKADPALLTFGSAGMGTLSHVAPAAFATFAGVEIEHIPYKGTAPALGDVMGNRLSLLSDSASVIRGPVTEGMVVPLAVLANERTTAMPDVPTIGEAGFAGFMELSDWTSWMGVLAPKDTPDEVVDKLNEIVNAALVEPEVQAWMDNVTYLNKSGMTPAEADAYLAESVDQWRKVLTDLGLAAQ
ncbi:tripartite tricarboxylate transporter substrate binding protein [Frigidibacter albus]|uniref:Tripartite tricarboxylate transporter substrate binding protein n=1 Tax=Frigidibacter albus TaxID=1465486 RepID=A0A6L8VL18_9RHOB|nr:tripartite tricarboxylate transporter substrate binding protein [Frigidibacter albus]MZQ91058.1 tripartite tricarboxylate transporter substrate binding protein [Frigidibacter albus]NBE32943.1 tripartite tricarboxylate transporter substrate binding protein [Frigidibacter albus]GGH62558.1 MFS transporter [Frigidibacter albus]